MSYPLNGFDDNIKRLYTIATDKAIRSVGNLAYHSYLSEAQRKALVASEILSLLYIQAEETPAERVRELLNDLVAANNAWFPNV